jgi:hypothetical protein
MFANYANPAGLTNCTNVTKKALYATPKFKTIEDLVKSGLTD